MNLAFDPGFFPKSTVTTKFGWDDKTYPRSPRIHHAVDRAGPGVVSVPIDVDRVKWVDEDGLGCSVLRLQGNGFELRCLHFIKTELNATLVDAIKNYLSVKSGVVIGPAGNKGLSVASKGGTGRHVHYQLLLEPGAYDDQLDAIHPGWLDNKIPEYTAKYGKKFTIEIAYRGILWMNEVAMEKYDPWFGKRLYCVDPLTLYGL